MMREKIAENVQLKDENPKKILDKVRGMWRFPSSTQSEPVNLLLPLFYSGDILKYKLHRNRIVSLSRLSKRSKKYEENMGGDE